MPLSLSDLVYKRRKDKKKLSDANKFNNSKKKKHKKLDAICEEAYTRSHEKAELSRLKEGENEMELRRSGRARKAPVLLDSSPPPRKKRQKVAESWVSSSYAEKVYRDGGVEGSPIEEMDGETAGWRSRLRNSKKDASVSGRNREESSKKGKRKLFEDLDGFEEAVDTRVDVKEGELVIEKSSVVKSERHGRTKVSNVLINETQEINLAGDVEDHDGSGDDMLESIDKGGVLPSAVKLGARSEAEEHDDCMASMSGEKEETAVPSESQAEQCDYSVNLENREESIEPDKLACDLVPDERDSAGQVKDVLPSNSPEDETCKSDKKGIINNVADQKPRIKLGRHCGLCGCGTDGKPPKLRLLEGYGSDNGVYSGPSDTEEPNYDVWDGFGDDSGWLGRLLGPINDRFGIAGIWVHQHCAVWSPEVYFAGLGCLKNVRAALYRGRVLKCSRCRRPGATIGCRVDRCPKTYHLPCARAKGCIFDHRKFLIACTDHRHLFQPYGIQNAVRLKKMKAKRLKLELRKMSNDACRKDIEAEEKLLEKCGEDEEFLRRESKRLQRDLCRIAPVYIGGANSENDIHFQGWESVAGLQNVIQCMKEVVIIPLLYPEFFSNLGVTPPRGILLHGYPGTGKTLVVRALVGSCARGEKRIAYFARKGADCLGKYVGDAERQLRLLFQVAEKSQPSIIFFDEIDGLAPCRTKQQDQTHSSVVSTLLALMDGLKSRGSVVVIGATNRPDAVDPALRRPGRFDREIYFPLPSLKDRESILSLHTQKWPKPISGSLLKWVANKTIGFAGADLQALCTQAAIIALRKNFPLQDVLSAAEMNPSQSKCPSIPNFFVEERDWLQALSCAPPPCSRREFGAAVNDVVAAPLDTFLVSCLVQPLTRLLIRLSLEDCIWLPTPLSNAFKLVKNVIVSSLSSRGVKSDNWLAHVDDLLQDVNLRNEIEKNLLHANGLVRQTSLCSADVIEEFNDEFCSKSFSSSSQFMDSSRLLKNMSCPSSNNSGFQMLISGNPKSAQRHMASCLLHCFVGKVDVWKVDLASISLEGHGDMSHGLTQLLMRCASANCCMIYMPIIDLWAIETCNETSVDSNESDSVNLQSTGAMTCNGSYVTAGQDELFTGADGELKKASCLWTSFIDQVESMRVNTSVIILATSELPFSLFPERVRQFFGNEIVNCSLSDPLSYKVPRFCVQLDEIFDSNKMICSFAAKLSKDLAQHFVQSVHNRNHTHENSSKEKVYDRVQDVTGACHSKSSPVCPLNPVAITNKMVKGRSSLLCAISTVGYQILCYPQFAELCWVTSKLKTGPFANVNGPWKGWPFNSCVIGPTNSTEQAATVSGPSIVKSKEFGVVRGLVAIGLSAYRGEYTSPREICIEVRNVLENLVGRIEDKVQAGKDKRQFIHLLSQVAYLEDLVTSWAYSLRSLEAETPVSHEHKGSCMGLLYDPVTKNCVSEGDGYKADVSAVFMQGSNITENVQDIDVEDGGDIEPTNGDNLDAGVLHIDIGDGGDIVPTNGYNLDVGDQVEVNTDKSSELPYCGDIEPANGDNLDAGDQVEVYMDKSSELPVSDHSLSVKHSSTLDDFCLNSAIQSNGFTGRCSGGGPVGNGGIELLSPTEHSCQPNDLCSSDDNIVSANTLENIGGTDIYINNLSKPASPSGFSSTMCFYQCCSECFMNLETSLLRIVTTEWGHKEAVDSTVEDVYHFLASLSVKFNLALCKLSQAETLSGIIRNEHSKYRNDFECQKCQGTGVVPHTESVTELMVECGCHSHTMGASSTGTENLTQSSACNGCSFFFKNGVLGSLGTSPDVPYHCKFEKLCLCFLREWLVTSKGLFD